MKDTTKEILRLMKNLFYLTIIGLLLYFIPTFCIFIVCINLFNTYLRIVIIGLIIYYFLLPLIFRFLVAPKFNASYKYKSKDFKGAIKKESLSKQVNKPSLVVNEDSGQYNINFGDKRDLIEGIIKINCNQQVYLNRRSLIKTSKALTIKIVDQLKGNDDLGGFHAYSFTYELQGQNFELIATIKEYPNQGFIIFELEFPKGLPNTSTGEYGELLTAFPSFLNKSLNSKIFTYRHAIFCPPNRKLEPTSAPVVFYDDDLNSFVVSPLDGFLNTAITQDKNGRINCGIQGEIKEVPVGASQKFLILFSKGINKPLEELGDLLRKYHRVQKKDPYGCIASSHLSYWTDNGAYYYYQKERGMSYEDTMVAVKEYFQRHNIPIKSYNFDSWWYIKFQSSFKRIISRIFKPLFRILGGGLFGNTIRWEADPDHFSTDLATYHKERFKYPIIAHSRRWDARSPYLKDYEFEVFENHAVPLKKEFWSWCMKHAKESGIQVYEQDWMKNQVNSIPILRENYAAKEDWLNSMATAANDNGVDVFYCMMTPGMLLYSMKHPSVVMARCSGDYNHRWPPVYREVFCTQTNILFNAVGINPHQDCFASSYELLGEHYPELKALIEVLTAGVVAPSDRMQKVNWPLLRKTCRDDGLLLKPDKPITANDLMFTKHSNYYFCDTYTRRKDLIWRYVLIVNMWPRRVKETFFRVSELGFDDEKYIMYDFRNGYIIPISNNEKIELGEFKKYYHLYYILCPITKSGMALIGCPEKFVTCSRKQYPMIESTADSLKFSIEDIEGAKFETIIYSEHKPFSVKIENGIDLTYGKEENAWEYLAASSKILIHIKFEKSGLKTITIKK